jgi:hypothetical protein
VKLFIFEPLIDRTGGDFRLEVGDETYHAGQRWVVRPHTAVCGPQVTTVDGWVVKTWTITRHDDPEGLLYGWFGFNEVKRVMQ